MNEPTDAELDAVLCNQWPAFSMQATLVRMWVRAAMRDVIAKWGTPPAGAGEPVAWRHDCAALLQNDIELWVDRCPHCGKPRTTAAPAAQGDAEDATYRERWDAELGRTAMKFVDRAGDVHPGVDDAEAICAEFHAAMSAVIERMPHVQRMNAANEDARAATRAAKEGGAA